jgi:hypothetical protein
MSLKFLIINNLERVQIDTLNYKKAVLIPPPQEITALSLETIYKLNKNTQISFINVENTDLLLNNLNESLDKYFSINITLQDNISRSSAQKLLEKFSKKELCNQNNREGYNLVIKNGNLIIFSLTEKGLFYGIQTLIQLLKNHYLTLNLQKRESLFIPQIKITDAPDLKMRGVAQDISRGQVCTVENAKRYIKILSHYKMNTYCLYMEDMFAHPDHPKIGKERGAFTCEEIKEIDTYAKKHFVELIPIFECLGHVDNILQHKKYRHLGEFPGAHSLDISNPEIYQFLTDYISKISKCFSTDYFHLGLDESFDVGKYNSKEYIESKGKSRAIIDFYNRLYEIAEKSGNDRVIMYDDIVRKDGKILRNLNKEMILMYWEYNPKIKKPPIEDYITAGHRVIASPSMLNWNRNFPDNKNASQNIINMIELAYTYREKGGLGVLTSTWGDQRYFSLRENEIFGAILTAEKAWNVENFNYDQFINKFGFLFYGIKKKSLEDFNNLFRTISSSAECYYRLRILLPPLFYTDFFKHPFPSKKFKPGLKKYEELEDIGKESLELYEQLIEKVNLEKDNFEYIQFGAELARYCGEKIRISVEVSDQLRKGCPSQKKLQEIIERINYIRDKIIYLKKKYETLWLRAAKHPCLDYNLRLFDALIRAYDNKISQLKEKIYFKNPFLESEWIWTNEKISPQKPRFFRKGFLIDKPVKTALIQGMVCTHMKIYVNGSYIGEVLGRFSLSRLPIILRVQIFDITPYLKGGENILAIEAVNYDRYKGAINLFGQLQFDDGSVMELGSDESWKYSKSQKNTSNDSWKTLTFNDENWDSVKSYGPPPNLNGDIIKPDLLAGELSLTQDYYGAQGYYFNAIDLFFGKISGFILKRLIGLIVKMAKLFG